MTRFADRQLTRRGIYRFLHWFESFHSVWQTTLICAGVAVFEIGWPTADQHLVAVLLVSLYATFTQNGLAHGNKLTSEKIDKALATIDNVADDTFASTKTLEAALRQHSQILERLTASDEADRTLLEGLAVALETQQHIVDTLIELAQRELELGDETRVRHIENQRMITDGMELIGKLFEATKPVEETVGQANGEAHGEPLPS